MNKILKGTLKPIAAVTRSAYYHLYDMYETVFGLRDNLTPPRSKIFIGQGDFRKVGDEFLQHFIQYGGLKKTDKVLDVGCGIGRMAVPLTGYLTKEASYEGFDIVPAGISWCNENISKSYPNFHFQIADVHSKRYYPKGKYAASVYKFPYSNETFDFVFLTSVFTHMLPADMENYLAEISRVLKPNGRCLITYLLLNKESEDLISQKQSTWSLKYQYSPICRVDDEDVPEGAIAYNETFIRDIYNKHSLNIINPIHYGSWSGRKDHLSFQDIIVAEKRSVL